MIGGVEEGGDLGASRRRPLTSLLTPWGETFDADCPLPEYPRPQLVRDSYLNLNGLWQYAITSSTDRPPRYDGEIVVPFSPEAPLSGVGRVLEPGQTLHYRRRVTLPEAFREDGDRVLLHFGAVDQWCRVEVNETVVAEHTGGYLPFTCAVGDQLQPGDNELYVVVQDPTDTGQLSRGKQRLKPGGIWYTPQSGMWQTVWLEAVPSVWVESLDIRPDLTNACVTVTVRAAGETEQRTRCIVTVLGSAGDEVTSAEGSPGVPLRLAVPNPRSWTPDDPYLYDVEVRLGPDRVCSYFGMRSFGIGPDDAGLPRLLLNGRPYFHAGVLDQGYWPDGLYTAPSDQALIHDIVTMKRLGFTMLRKHIKVEPLRWYHHCDRLGMLVWQDMVNGGGTYRWSVAEVPAFVPLRLGDHWYPLFARDDAVARAEWLSEMRGTVELLRNVVGLALWVPFNEGWGQFDAAAVTAELRALDPTRPVDHASGWHDHGAGDITSRHVYLKPFRVPRRRRRTRHRVLALTE